MSVRSPAAAIAWELGRRHRVGLTVLALYFVVLAAIRLLVVGPGERVTYVESWSYALVVVIPLAATSTFSLAVFSYGLAGDLAARASIYPTRMFTLPVTNAALVGWPMLFGTVAMAALWVLTRLFALWPADVDVPWLWPALFAAVLVAWTQALTWLPYPLPGLRVLLTVLWMSVIAFGSLLALHLEASEALMLGLLAPHLPLAYVVARVAVARARRGDVPDARRWRLWPKRGGLARARPPFRSPAEAQAWLEWRRHGRALPVMVALVLPFELAMLFAFRETPVIVLETLVAVALTPPLLATFVAATVGRSSPDASDAHRLTPFLAARPLNSAALVAAKIRATVWSAAAAWSLVLVSVPLALALSGTWSVVVDGADRLVELAGAPRAAVGGLLGLTALVVSTWRQLVQGLYIGMSGRAWLVKASVFGTLALLTLLVSLGPWVLRTRGLLALVWDAAPWILAVLVLCKVAAAARIAVGLCDRQLVGARTLVLGAAGWTLTVLALHGLLVWLVPTLFFPAPLLALVAILAIPLARVSAAPLALAWNRHR